MDKLDDFFQLALLFSFGPFPQHTSIEFYERPLLVNLCIEFLIELFVAQFALFLIMFEGFMELFIVTSFSYLCQWLLQFLKRLLLPLQSLLS